MDDFGLFDSAQDGLALVDQGIGLISRRSGIEDGEDPLGVAVFDLVGEIWVLVDEFDFLLEYFDVRFVVNTGSPALADGCCGELPLYQAMYQRGIPGRFKRKSNEPAVVTTSEQHHGGRGHRGKGTEVRQPAQRCLRKELEVMALKICNVVLRSMLLATSEDRNVMSSICSLQSMSNAGRHVLQGYYWRCDAR